VLFYLTMALVCGRVYAIMCNKTGTAYIGSTIKSLEHRLSEHVYNYTRYQIGKARYVSSFEIIKNGDYKIELIEQCDNITRLDLLYREGAAMRAMSNCVNKQKLATSAEDAIINRKQVEQAYYVKNINKIREYSRVHADKCNERSRDQYARWGDYIKTCRALRRTARELC
jgi:hypothetical protein